MEYQQTREDILQYLGLLQQKGFSYQSICDYINSQQEEFVLYKDFFTRFQSKPTYFKSSSKKEKLFFIHQYIQILYQQNVEQADTVKEVLRLIVYKALTEKFEASLNANRTLHVLPFKIAELYLEDSPAYHAIKNDLLHKDQYEWELDILNRGSTFKILDLEVTDLFQQSAVVATEEFWKLFWVDKHSKKLQFKYESLAHHTYLLVKKEKGNWKIIENMTKKASNTRLPVFVDYPNLHLLSSDNRATNKMTTHNFLASNDILNAIEFIKISSSLKFTPVQLTTLTEFKESYLNTHRLLNTKVVRVSVYQEEIQLLKTRVELFCEVIDLEYEVGD